MAPANLEEGDEWSPDAAPVRVGGTKHQRRSRKRCDLTRSAFKAFHASTRSNNLLTKADALALQEERPGDGFDDTGPGFFRSIKKLHADDSSLETGSTSVLQAVLPSKHGPALQEVGEKLEEKVRSDAEDWLDEAQNCAGPQHDCTPEVATELQALTCQIRDLEALRLREFEQHEAEKKRMAEEKQNVIDDARLLQRRRFQLDIEEKAVQDLQRNVQQQSKKQVRAAKSKRQEQEAIQQLEKLRRDREMEQQQIEWLKRNLEKEQQERASLKDKVQRLQRELSEKERQISVLAQREAAERNEVQQLMDENHMLAEREAAAVREKEEAMKQALEGPGLPHHHWTACAIYMQAQTILDSLGIDSRLFERRYDRCYCPACYKRKYPDTIMNDSPTPYVVPRGWVRFGLKLPAHSKAMGVMEKWCVSFHGNSPDVLKSIITTGGFVFPGDVMPNGKILQSSKCVDRTDKCVYTSPTANYAGRGFYATPTKGPGNMLYQAIIQCRQKPDSFDVGAETMGFRNKWDQWELCPHVSVKRIEWMTNWRNTLVPYGLLIRAWVPGSPPKHFKSPVDPRGMLS